MNDVVSINIYFCSEQPERRVIEFLGSILGFAVESTDVPMENSKGFVMVMEYAEGYKHGFLISYPSNNEALLSPEQVAKKLSAKFDSQLLLEIEGRDDYWLHVTPDGLVKMRAIVYFDDGVGPVFE
ncbi:MAG TPA: hypothetical protein VF800_27940 [Telluria sp.]|jgi:hypothetical protein